MLCRGNGPPLFPRAEKYISGEDDEEVTLFQNLRIEILDHILVVYI